MTLPKPLRDKLLSARYLAETVGVRPATHPRSNFASIEDPAWYWVNTRGSRRSRRLRDSVPSLPRNGMQNGSTGLTGDAGLRQAFEFYRLVKEEADRWHDGGYPGCSDAIDFGCGWGRITRFFLKDFEPGHLLGLDCVPAMIDAATATDPWCDFRLVAPLPPTPLESESTDLVFAFSVFSHLSEDAHLAWLEEFHRLLRPGGLAVLTTRSLSWFEQASASGLAVQETRWADRYGAGEFCHMSYESSASAALDGSLYGESAIPPGYARQVWSERFEVVDWIDDPDRCVQVVAVVRRPA